jgi:ATP-dependent Clp protease ATP-binding subunit ClpC
MWGRSADPQTAALMKLSLIGSIGIGLLFLWQQAQSNRIVAVFVFLLGVGLMVRRALEIRRRELGLPCNRIDRRRMDQLRIVPSIPMIQECLRGHDAVVREICSAIDGNLQLGDGSRSLGTFMLVGPTGTGKTYLSELIGGVLFPKAAPVILRMNQYKDTSDVKVLFGGGDQAGGGHLTAPVIEDPHRVVILDELEKAHPDVIHALYDVLDAGYCRDKESGRLISFEACVFIATCNKGVDELRALRETRSGGEAAWIGKARDALGTATGFERSFLARWDQIFLMDQLSMFHIAEVACLEISRFWQEHGMEVAFASPKLVVNLVRENQEFRQYGVHQLQQLIRLRSDRAVLRARETGCRSVVLDIGLDGEVQVRRAA